MPPADIGGQFSIAGSTLGSRRQGGRHLLKNLRLGSVDLSSLTVFGSISLSGSVFSQHVNLVDWKVEQIEGRASTGESSGRDLNDHLFPNDSLEITGAVFESGLNIARVAVDGSVLLAFPEGCRSIDIEVLSARGRVCVRSTNFADYMPITVSSEARVSFERCQFLRGGVIECVSPDLAVTSCDARQPLTFLTPLGSTRKTALTSLAYSNVENFIVQDVDLTKGYFSGVANLDKLRLEGRSQQFDRSVTGPNRLVIQDEVFVRSKKKKWKQHLVAAPSGVSPDPSRVAAAYRCFARTVKIQRMSPAGPTSTMARWK